MMRALRHTVAIALGKKGAAGRTEPPVEAVRSAWRLGATMKRLGAVGGTILSEERPSMAVGAMAAEVGADRPSSTPRLVETRGKPTAAIVSPGLAVTER